MPDQGRVPPAASASQGEQRLDSWGEIAAHVHRSISTVQRWEKHEGLPVDRIPHSKLGSVYATSGEIDAWYKARSQSVRAPASDAAAGRITLAVLPFQNLSDSADQDYFSDGLTEELTTHLARLRPDRLAVIARTSAMQYRNSGKDVRAIGAELGVAYVLEGSVRRGAGQVRVTAQLVSTSDGLHLWAETYNEAPAGFIEIQTAIAERVGDSLSIQLLSEQHIAHARARQTSPETRDEYLKGRYLWNRRTTDAFRQARAHFQRAIELDANFAPAYAGLADTYACLGFWVHGGLPPKEAFPLARQAAEQALRLDAGLAEAHATLGLLHYQFDWDWEAAEHSFRRALELNPSYATGRQWYSLCLALQERSADALAESGRARELDVLSDVVDCAAGWTHYLGRDYEKARKECVRALSNNPDFPLTHLLLAAVHCFMGHPEEAFREHNAYDRLNGNPSVGLAFRACHHAYSGKRRPAKLALAELRGRLASSRAFSWQLALVHASLGEADEAFAALESAFEEHSDMLAFLKVEPHWDPLQSDPRFGDMLKRVGLD